MAVPYTRNMKQQATYWAPLGNDGSGGVAFAAPVTVMCRWEDKADLVRSANGQEVPSSAVVYPVMALEPKGYLALGDQTAEDNPKDLPGVAFQIINVAASPDLRNTRVLNKAWL